MDVLIWLKQELELLADSNSKAHLMHYRNNYQYDYDRIIYNLQ